MTEESSAIAKALAKVEPDCLFMAMCNAVMMAKASAEVVNSGDPDDWRSDPYNDFVSFVGEAVGLAVVLDERTYFPGSFDSRSWFVCGVTSALLDDVDEECIDENSDYADGVRFVHSPVNRDVFEWSSGDYDLHQKAGLSSLNQ